MRINKKRLLLLLVLGLLVWVLFLRLSANPQPDSGLALLPGSAETPLPTQSPPPDSSPLPEGSDAPVLDLPLLSDTPDSADSEAELPDSVPTATPMPTPTPSIAEDGEYDGRDDVALYIHLYGRLPSNYITKKQAEALGWSGGSLEPYAPGKSVGGGRFGNYEGLLPEAKGRIYYECDIDTRGAKSRGAKRLVYSSDGLIYYTEDHYESFTLLYGETE